METFFRNSNFVVLLLLLLLILLLSHSSPISQKPNQIHSESIRNPTKPWRIYQIHIMIPAIKFQKMLPPPNFRKKNLFRGDLLLGSLHYSACVYSPLFFSTFFFSFTFSILLILSLSLLYSFHVVSLSALARSLTVIVDIGSLLRELNLELILFKLALILPALSSLFFSTLLVFILPSSFQLFFLLYLLHPSDSFPFSSLLFSCSLFKCNCRSLTAIVDIV